MKMASTKTVKARAPKKKDVNSGAPVRKVLEVPGLRSKMKACLNTRILHNFLLLSHTSTVSKTV